jgi:ParB family chromosome partitioning protein
MSKFGLGKGLADLQVMAGESPEISTLAGIPERVVVRQIALSQIGANPDQPRKTFAPEELEDLAQSIREHGVLQPIIVRSVMGMPHLYEIVAGERRWRASELAGKDTIPALVKPLTAESAMEIALIENVQRENLNAIEECDAYRNIMDKLGYKLSDLSRLIGKSESYIRNIMRLAALPDNVKDMVKSGAISASHARTLAVAENADELARKVAAENLSVADAADLVRAAPKNRREYPLDALQALEREVSDGTGLAAKISVRANGSGHISIQFNTIAQMEMLAKSLSSLGAAA